MSNSTVIRCYQCGIPISSDPLIFNVNGVEREFCCSGCYLVNKISGSETSDKVQSFFIKFGISFFLSGFIMMLSFSIYGADVSKTQNDPLVKLTSAFLLFLSTPVMILMGGEFLKNSFFSLLKKRFSTDILITIGAFSAFFLSVYSTLTGKGVPYYETATMILSLSAFGKFIEAYGRYKAAKNIGSVQDLLPSEVTILKDDKELRIPINELKAGMIIKVKPGETIAADGEVISGEGYVKESFFTGESKPVLKTEGSKVLGGSVNIDGAFLIKAFTDFENSTISKVIENIEIAKLSFIPEKSLADKISAVFVPVVSLLAIGSFLFWLKEASLDKAIMVSLSVLLIACPCAFNVAAPLALWNAANRLAFRGVIIRDLGVLYRLRHIDTIFFDKTGTITMDTLYFHSYKQVGSDKDFIEKVASLESYSEHPFAKSFLESFNGELKKPSKVRIIAGFGLEGFFGNERWLIGSKELMEKENIDINKLNENFENFAVVYVAKDKDLEGVLLFTQKADESSLKALDILRKKGYSLKLLSGDEEKMVKEFKDYFDDIFWSLKPEDKALIVKKEKARSKKVMFVGDGINDAVAMSISDISVAVSNASALARASANIILIKRNLKIIPWLINFSDKVRKVMIQNFWWASVYNIFGISLAMAGLINPLLSALFMTISSVSVVYNSSRVEHF